MILLNRRQSADGEIGNWDEMGAKASFLFIFLNGG
jgi:hypothetical protein